MSTPLPTADSDPFLWLEGVEDPTALDWVKARNAKTLARLADPTFDADRAAAHAILTAETKLPHIIRRGPHVYNFWTDTTNKRGLWRRTSLASFRTDAPDWESVLDIDALGAADGVSWVWGGSSCRPPAFDRAIVRLSRGGADAVELREFDLVEKRFVDGGFRLSEARVFSVNWIDDDTLLITTTHAPAKATSTGYPREARRWTRGTDFARSEVVFAVEESDTGCFSGFDRETGEPRFVYGRWIDFHNKQITVEDAKGRVTLDLPTDTQANIDRDLLFAQPRTPWAVGNATHPAGSLLVIGLDAFRAGDRQFTRLFTPSPRVALDGYLPMQGKVVLSLLDNVKTRIQLAERHADGRWTSAPMAGLPANSTLHLSALDDPVGETSDEVTLQVMQFLTPPSLHVLKRPGAAPELLKAEPGRFDASGCTVTQHDAITADGTAVPYYQITGNGVVAGRPAPTLLYGYGGFQISLLPAYIGMTGKLWLEKGGVFVQANIRGGGEFGPEWHIAGVREKKRASHDDFAAIAADLVRRGVTTPDQLGAWGGSNGGLLVGAMLTRYPERFGAIWCQVPLLDMRRFHKLLVGASWMAEYGDPDKPEDWAFLKDNSPYHLVAKDRRYPPALFTTSTRDDRVHPGHARKMAALLDSLGAEALLYENMEGGHAGAADADQRAFQMALGFAFLRATIGKGLATS
ncbi:MAG: prolyl oligopeptidase family serine peptidase [Hyphomicrobiaceae bacterium]